MKPPKQYRVTITENERDRLIKWCNYIIATSKDANAQEDKKETKKYLTAESRTFTRLAKKLHAAVEIDMVEFATIKRRLEKGKML